MKSNSKYVLYAHDGSGNHGCEAIVRSTAKVLNVNKDNLVLISKRPEEEVRYGVSELCAVVPKGAIAEVKRNTMQFAKAYLDLKVRHQFAGIDYLGNLAAIGAKKGDVALSIGGDTYCYGGFDEIIETNNMLKYGGLKTVYWGCSIEPELLNNPRISADIKCYNMIAARETISYNALKETNPNTVLVSDTAFVMDKIELLLPVEFQEGNTVGINISPLIIRQAADDMIYENYVKLIEYILNNTNMSVCLIPHVVWDHDNDLVLCDCLYEKFKDTKRVSLIKDCGARELKGYISRCKFLVASRTHASIAAYSTGVPTLVIGYSVKSKGIAMDIFGTDQDFVISAKDITNKETIVDAFKWLLKNEMNIRDRLYTIMPEYKSRAFNGLKRLEIIK